MNRSQTGSRAFTLIELLVVVAILALLIAILLPGLSKAKQQALRTKCGTTIRGWGTAVTTYQQENGGMFAAKLTYLGGGYIGTQWDQDPKAVSGINATVLPASGVADPISGGSGNIMEGIYSTQASGHVLNSKLRFCPASDATYQGASGVFYYGNRPLPSYKFAYYANATGAANANQPNPYWNINKFKELSNKLMMCDSNAKDNYGDCVTWIDDPAAGGVIRNLNGGGGSPRTTYSTKDELAARHGSRGNVLFLDCHVDCVPYTEYVKNIPNTPGDSDANKRWTRMSQ